MRIVLTTADGREIVITDDGPEYTATCEEIQEAGRMPCSEACGCQVDASEEECVRCGWRMGGSPLNCQNDGTPHSQLAGTELHVDQREEPIGRFERIWDPPEGETVESFEAKLRYLMRAAEYEGRMLGTQVLGTQVEKWLDGLHTVRWVDFPA